MRKDFIIILFILFFINVYFLSVGQNNNAGNLKDTIFGHQKIQVLQFEKNSIKNYPFSINDSSDLKVDTLKDVFNGDTIEELHYYSKGEMIKNIRYKNRKLKKVCEYKNGKLHGMEYEFYDNNNLENYFLYEKGEIITWIKFYENGMIKHFRIDDTISAQNNIAKHYYKSGKLKDVYIMDFKNNNKTHEIHYYENGNLIYENYYNAGKRKMATYYDDGKILDEFTYFDMSLYMLGEVKKYHQNGKLQFQAFYKDGNSREEANYRIGTWSWWDEKGNLIRQEFYKENKLIEVKEYLPEIKEQEK